MDDRTKVTVILPIFTNTFRPYQDNLCRNVCFGLFRRLVIGALVARKGVMCRILFPFFSATFSNASNLLGIVWLVLTESKRERRGRHLRVKLLSGSVMDEHSKQSRSTVVVNKEYRQFLKAQSLSVKPFWLG